jgi:pilus assembly protein CpaF
MWTITLHHPDHAVRHLRIPSLPCRIGRSHRCEISLPGWRVAKVHAEIREVAGSLHIDDLGSISGTCVNGQRIERFGPLTPADEIEIAGFRMLLNRPEPALMMSAVAPPLADPADALAPAAAVLPSANRAPVAARPVAPLVPPTGPVPPVLPVLPVSGVPIVSDRVVRTSVPIPVSSPPGARGSASALLQSWSARLQRETLRALDLRRQDLSGQDDAGLREQVTMMVRQLIASSEGFPASIDIERLVREVVDAALGLGPLDELLSDPAITEIMVNGPREIWVERQGRLQRSALCFQDEQDLRRVLDRIVTPVGRRIDEASPMVDARLADGSRVNAVLAPLALRGSALTIRRFMRSVLSLDDLVTRGSASPEMLQFLGVCVGSRRNIVISGGTGSGKTTLLNVLSNLIPPGERVVTIEDAAELSLQGEHVVSLEARPPNLEQRGEITIRDLVRNALRMRPDRIVVGECRGGEALDMLQAMNTGHDGSLTTVHANSARDVISRLEVLALMAGMDLPVLALREQIASAIDIIVHQARFADGLRRIVAIVEVTGLESGRVQIQPIFEYRPGQGFGACAVVPQFYEPLARSGADLDLAIFSGQTDR